MASSPPLATVLGLAYESPVTEFPIRSGPGTNFDPLPFKAKKGWNNLRVLDVQPDSQNTPNDNQPAQVYQWFRLAFPNGQIGWLRAHILGISGDLRAFGYGIVPTITYAYLLRREATQVVQSPPASESLSPAQPQAAGAQAGAAAGQAPAPARPTGQPTAVAMVKSPTYVTRVGPSSVGFERAFPLPYKTSVPILEVQREQRAQRLRWFKVSHQGQQAWAREDFVTVEGDTSALGLATDLYPAPMRENRWWVRGFNVPPDNDPLLVNHDGWDLGAGTGEPIYCGPSGGLVVQSFQCRKCTRDRPSALMHGHSLGDPSILQDEGWGFGYGNFIIVRYFNDQLPPSTRDLLTARGFPGGHIFVMYAHLEQRLIEGSNVELPAGAQIASCGNTGNSQAPHLHLEIRASRSPEFVRWAALRNGLLDPVALFKR